MLLLQIDSLVLEQVAGYLDVGGLRGGILASHLDVALSLGWQKHARSVDLVEMNRCAIGLLVQAIILIEGPIEVFTDDILIVTIMGDAGVLADLLPTTFPIVVEKQGLGQRGP